MDTWNQQLIELGAVFENGHIAHFGDPPSELQASASGNIITDLSHLTLLQVDGEDAIRFLQGQLTNDIKALDNSSQYAGYCTAKGRLLALFLAFAHYDHLHLQLNGEIAEAIMKRLKMYVLRSKVKINDVSASIVRIGVSGPDAGTALSKVFGQIPQAPHQLVSSDGGAVLMLPGTTPRYLVYCSLEHAQAIWLQLRSNCKAVGHPCWEWLEIQAGIPDIVHATQEQFVPQMVNLDLIGGISFKKGCYTGQEIVARTHYLGKVKRRTVQAHVENESSPTPGNLLFGDESSEAVGMVVRAAPSPKGGYDLLAEVRLESMAAGSIRLSAKDGALLAITPLTEIA